VAGARRLFCFLQLEKQTRSNISLVLKPRKDSQGFMQRLLRASHSASMLRYSRGCQNARMVFRFKGSYSLRDAFSFRKRCSICPRERKWLINDSCAFSDERPREGFALGCRLCLRGFICIPGGGFLPSIVSRVGAVTA
jgi:hypothetical protein